MRLAGDAGRAIGAAASTFQAALEDTGYERSPDGRGGILLTNCPFHRLARRHTDLVCHANLELLREATGDQQHTIVLDPAADRCCVRGPPAQRTLTSIDRPGP
jgi:predicted ArsR family transcriptional regulator